MIQGNILIKRKESLQVDSNSDKKKLLLKKSKTMEQTMMDEFLSRQQVYDRINGPIIKLEQQKVHPPKPACSKLRDTVHLARQRYEEFNQKKKDVKAYALNKKKLPNNSEQKKQTNIKETENDTKEGGQQIKIIHVTLSICLVLLYLSLIQFRK